MRAGRRPLRSEPPLTRPIQRILFALRPNDAVRSHAQNAVLNEGKQMERSSQGDSNARETRTFRRVSPDPCCFPPNVLQEKPCVTVQMAEHDHTCTACAAALAFIPDTGPAMFYHILSRVSTPEQFFHTKTAAIAGSPGVPKP